ncbi:major facilitator superfamily domain-containing protein [Sordaria brevicollis]|uniref:Major facilitator superfamily domain-containing protein n=1 Tax=Sordaria brevicollis TaxID=83679 RepID=A0AAE0PBL4_SORBR|nr:major facilitator superfamily domain-containing protein [Sordaria brevicollis]
MAVDETTPLLPHGTGTGTAAKTNNNSLQQTSPSSPNTTDDNLTPTTASSSSDHYNDPPTKRKSPLNPLHLLTRLSVETRILLAAFLITTSFSFTQVPIFYVFYLMECDDFYSHHPSPPHLPPGADKCSRNEIAAGTATDFSFLAMSTTICGTVNLFFAGWLVKKIGPRLALMAQTLVPAIRVLTQILGVLAGGRSGIVIFQATQLITVLGGPVGYILIINIIVGEVVSPARRTPVFGMLQGCFMLGQAVGYLTGGMIGDRWGIRRPFEVAFVAFLVSTVYVQVMLPYVSPESMSGGSKKEKAKGIAGFLAPLKVLAPQRVRLRSGKTIKHLGVLILCTGVFLGVLATDFAAMLIQMYATAVFEFHQSDNGWLMSEFAMMRAVFLILLFPKIISYGRKWYAKRQSNHQHPRRDSISDERDPATQGLLIQPEQLEAPMGTHAEEEPMMTQPGTETEDTHFDLFFLRWSLVADGLLTSCTALATKKWHIYLAAAMLPFASGTAPAAKGVMTEMCSPSQRADALNALTLVENIGRLATQGFFGFVFAALAEAGKPHLTFYCNAILAMIAASVLIFSRFPPNGSTLIDADEETEDDDDDVNGSSQNE